MALLPDSGEFVEDFTTTEQPSRTYKLGFDDERIVGKVDELEAIKQAAYKIINTERYQYIIYSWNYGIELRDLFGKPIPYVYPEIKRRIYEALTWDDRINDVTDFSFSNKKGDVLVTFTVHSVAGAFQVEKGVKIA